MSVYVVGSLHLDVVVEAPRLPQLDETLVGQAVSYRFGGKGGNQAVAAARMGAEVAMAGAVGRDGFAEALLAGLDVGGVDRSRVARLPGASGMSVAIVDGQGEYGAVIVSAANLSVSVDDTVPKHTRVLLLQNEVPEAANLAAARLARKAGARVVLNAAPARAVAADLLALTDILIVNRGEAVAMSGHPADDVSETAAALAELGPPAVIITLGPDGLCLCHGGRTEFVPAVPVKAVSTHGAGDMFAGALAARLDGGDTLGKAVDFARAAAALRVSTVPDTPVTAADVLAFRVRPDRSDTGK